MAIITSIQTATDQTQQFAQTAILMKEFLKSAGWIVVGSARTTGDGSGGMHYDGGTTDRIGTDPANMGVTGWFVLESPHVVQGDRIQLLFWRTSATDVAGNFAWTPTAANGDRYESGDATLPTSAYSVTTLSGSVITQTIDTRLHMVADTASPYGFGILNTTARDARSSHFCISLIPINVHVPATNAGKPYALISCTVNINNYRYNNLFDDDSVENSGTTSAEPFFPPQIPVVAPACTLNSESFVVVPRNISQLDNGDEVTFPITFASPSSQYFGISDFAMWNGTNRERLETFNDGSGPMTRICFGDINFPWDGSTIPII